MSQHHAVLIDELWNETERLRTRVEELQSQLAQSDEPESKVENHDIWNVWPYSWAHNAGERGQAFLAERFHSFHEKRLVKQNRKSQRAFWNTPHPEDIEMKLV